MIAGFTIFAIVNAGYREDDPGDTQVVVLPKGSNTILKIEPDHTTEQEGDPHDG